MTDHIRLDEFFSWLHRTTWNVQKRKKRVPFNATIVYSIPLHSIPFDLPHYKISGRTHTRLECIFFVVVEIFCFISLVYARPYPLFLIISNRKLHYDCGYKCHTVLYPPQCITAQMSNLHCRPHSCELLCPLLYCSHYYLYRLENGRKLYPPFHHSYVSSALHPNANESNISIR